MNTSHFVFHLEVDGEHSDSCVIEASAVEEAHELIGDYVAKVYGDEALHEVLSGFKLPPLTGAPRALAWEEMDT